MAKAGGVHGKGRGVVHGKGRGCTWQRGVCMTKGVCMAKGGGAWQGACVAGEMATAADGTHPTGMHSC